jgi:hypothetical protein
MALELIAAVVAAFAMAGIALILRKLSGQRLPRWIIPVAAGAGLLGFTVWSEYDWFSRVSAELPTGVEIVDAPKVTMPIRPWTYVAPLTTRFTAIDHRATVSPPDNPDLLVAREIVYARWIGAAERLVIVDCAGDRQALLAPGVSPDGQGGLTGADWVDVGEDNAFQRAACKED